MNSAHVRDLSYGRAGEARYNRDEQHWSLQRNPGVGPTFHPLGPVRSVLKGTIVQSPTETTDGFQERARKIRHIIASDPDVAPATHLLDSLFQISQAVLQARVASEPPPCDLISFGAGQRFARPGRLTKPVDLVAMAAGVSGESVKILLMRPDQAFLKGLPEQDLHIPGFENDDAGWWSGSAVSPIQQICFSETLEGQGSWLAVRNSLGTTLFRPVFHNRLVGQSYSFNNESGPATSCKPSHLNANRLVNIPNSRAGAAVHIQVSFNPWLEQQVAILESNGDWNIYECPVRSSLNDGLDDAFKLAKIYSSEAPLNVLDGWGTILWAGGPETIVVASRTALSIYHLGQKLQMYKVPDIEFDDEEAIIDIRRVPYDPSYIFVLTTSRFCWYHVYNDEEISGLEDDQPAASLLLAWQHQHNPHDTTLRIILSTIPDFEDVYGQMLGTGVAITQVIIALIYSKKSDLIVSHAFALSHDQNVGYSISDPFSISSELLNLDGPSESNVSCTLLFRQIKLNEDVGDHASLSSFKKHQLFSLIQLGSDLSVRERLLVLGQSLDVNATPLHWSTPDKSAYQRENRLAATEDFIVPDGIALEDALSMHDEWLPFEDATVNTIRDDQQLPMMELLRQTEAMRVNVLTPGTFDEEIERVLSERAELDIGLHTMAEFLSTELPVDEIEKFSTTVQEIINAINGAHGSQPSHLDTEEDQPPISSHALVLSDHASILRENAQESTSDASRVRLLSLYGRVLSEQISKLSQDVPGRTRVMLEREFRKTAMQVYLSSYGVKSMTQAELQAEPSLPSANVAGDMTLTIRRRGSPVSQDVTRNTNSSQQHDSGYASYPSGAANISLGTSTQQSNATQPITEQSTTPPFDALSAFVSFTKPHSFGTLSAQTIDEWEVGEHPAQFDWQKARHSTKNLISQSQVKKKKPRSKLHRPQQAQSLPPHPEEEGLPQQHESSALSRTAAPKSPEAQASQPTTESTSTAHGAASSSQRKPKSAKPKKSKPGF